MTTIAIAGKPHFLQVWLIPIADERVSDSYGMQVKLWDPLRTRAIPEVWGGSELVFHEEALLSSFTLNYLYNFAVKLNL